MIGFAPEPIKDTVVGLPIPLCATDKAAPLAPTLVGVNVTLTVQLWFGDSVAAQVVVRAKCTESVPVTVIAFAGPFVNTRVSVPGLLTVMVCAVLVELMS